MDRLEQELKQALARQHPSAGFEERVAAAVRRGPVALPVSPAASAVRPKVRVMPRWLSAAAALAIIVGGAAYRRHQGMVAKEQVMLAMRITAGRLNHIQSHVKEARP